MRQRFFSRVVFILKLIIAFHASLHRYLIRPEEILNKKEEGLGKIINFDSTPSRNVDSTSFSIALVA